MDLKKRALFNLFIFILLNFHLTASENLPLHLKIMSTKNAEAPQIWNEKIFLTAKPLNKTRYVGVAFEYESYNIIHNFTKNEYGVFIFSDDIPERTLIKYRLIIDGLWMADPMGINNTRDKNGITVSSLVVTRSNRIKAKGPIYKKTGETNFTVQSQANATVSIVGSFNGWDPYMTPMEEINEGIYSCDLILKDGEYYYYFIIDGEKAMDPMNFFRSMNREGEEVSKLLISGN